MRELNEKAAEKKKKRSKDKKKKIRNKRPGGNNSLGVIGEESDPAEEDDMVSQFSRKSDISAINGRS